MVIIHAILKLTYNILYTIIIIIKERKLTPFILVTIVIALHDRFTWKLNATKCYCLEQLTCHGWALKLTTTDSSRLDWTSQDPCSQIDAAN